MSVLDDVDRIETPGTLSWRANARNVTIDAQGRLGVGTTTPQVEVHVAGTAATVFAAGTSAQRPASPETGCVRVETGGANDIVTFYDGSSWYGFPALSHSQSASIHTVLRLSGQSSVVWDGSVSYRSFRILLCNVTVGTPTTSVVVTGRNANADTGGTWETIAYGTTGDGTRTPISVSTSASGIVLVDGTNFRATSSSPLEGVLDLFSPDTAATNRPIQAFFRGWAYSPAKAAPTSIHWSMGVSANAQPLQGVRIYVGAGTFSSGIAVVMHWPV